MVWFGKNFFKFVGTLLNLIKLLSTKTYSSARVRFQAEFKTNDSIKGILLVENHSRKQPLWKLIQDINLNLTSLKGSKRIKNNFILFRPEREAVDINFGNWGSGLVILALHGLQKSFWNMYRSIYMNSHILQHWTNFLCSGFWFLDCFCWISGPI